MKIISTFYCEEEYSRIETCKFVILITDEENPFYIEDRFDENYLEMKAPGIYRNIPDVDTTVETNTIDYDVGQENDVFKCKICFIYFSLSLSYKYYIHV